MKITGAANLTFAFSWHLNKVLNFPLSALLSAYYFGAGYSVTSDNLYTMLS